jgi:hypothetical protein
MGNKYSSSLVAQGGWGTSMSGYKALGWADQLVDTDYLSGVHSRLDRPAIGVALVAPGLPVRLPIGAAWTDGGIDICKISRDMTCFGKEAEVSKAKLSQLFMDGGQALLLTPGQFQSRIFGILMATVNVKRVIDRSVAYCFKILILKWDDVGILPWFFCRLRIRLPQFFRSLTGGWVDVIVIRDDMTVTFEDTPFRGVICGLLKEG